MSINTFLGQVVKGDHVKDFTHASNTFVDGAMRLHPKTGFLYHVFFDLHTDVPARSNTNANIELGMMAKRVSLPKFTMDNKAYNAYNRVNLVQTKIKYDAVNITFHDDMANVVNNFWQDYYNYYYADSTYAESIYNTAEHKYGTRLAQKWGYSPMASTPYLSAIRIYQLHQKRFSEYVLINPIITSWQHGEQNYASSDPVESSMTVAFETVKYTANVNVNGMVKGFGELHYDNSPSPLTPLGGGTHSILGPGGLLDTAESIADSVAEGDVLGTIFKTARGVSNLRDASLSDMVMEEGKSIAKSIISGKNVTSKFSFPGVGMVTDLFK